MEAEFKTYVERLYPVVEYSSSEYLKVRDILFELDQKFKDFVFSAKHIEKDSHQHELYFFDENRMIKLNVDEQLNLTLVRNVIDKEKPVTHNIDRFGLEKLTINLIEFGELTLTRQGSWLTAEKSAYEASFDKLVNMYFMN